MLYAASIKVSYAGNHRRIDVIVNADNLEKAKEKALKQARKIYAPNKKAIYKINGIIDETEAFQSFFAKMSQEEEIAGP